MHSPGNPGKRQYRVDMLVDTWNGSPRHVSTFFWCFFLDTLAAVNIGYDKCPILETCWLKIQNGHISGKIVAPLWGFPGICQKTTAPDAPASLFPDPNGAQIKDCMDNKTVEKKVVPTPCGRAHHRWCPWVGKKIGGAFRKQVAFTKGWMTSHGKRPPNVSVLFNSPGNPGKRWYRVGMLVDTWNGSPRHVSTFFWCFFLDTLAAVNIGYDKCPTLETC